MTRPPAAPSNGLKLQLKIGGPAGAQITEGMRRLAEERIAELAPQGIAEIVSRVREFAKLAQTRSPEANRTMFRHMHEIRGMAGTFGIANVGAICDTTCLYLDGLPAEATPDPTLMALLLRSVQQAVRLPDDPLLGDIILSARAAVAQVRRREGRPI